MTTDSVHLNKQIQKRVKLDTIHRVTTPEGVELTLSLAGPLSRARAYMVDFIIRIGLVLIASMILGLLGSMGWGLFFIFWFIIDWFYPVICEVFYRGASPGKRAMKIMVVRDNGTPVGWRDSLLRNLLRAVDTLPFMYLFGYVSMILNSQFKRLGDLAAGTIVVYQPTKALSQPVAHVDAMPSRFLLKLHEQQSVIDFAQRAPSITPERAEEIARLAGDLTRGNINVKTDFPYAEKMIGVANYFMGKESVESRMNDRDGIDGISAEAKR